MTTITKPMFVKAGGFFVVGEHKFVAQEPKRYDWQDKDAPLHQMWVADTCSWKVMHALHNGEWMFCATSQLDSTLFTKDKLKATQKAIKRHDFDMDRARMLINRYGS